MNLANDTLRRVPLGTGLRSPPEIDPATKDLRTVTEEENVTQCIRDLIETRVGEIPGLEDYGTTILDDLFESPGAVIDTAPDEILSAIRRWEPRVANVAVSADEGPDNSVIINVSWTYRATGAPGELTVDTTGGSA